MKRRPELSPLITPGKLKWIAQRKVLRGGHRGRLLEWSPECFFKGNWLNYDCHLVRLHHHATVIADHLASGHYVHRPDACPQASHLLHPVQHPHSASQSVDYTFSSHIRLIDVCLSSSESAPSMTSIHSKRNLERHTRSSCHCFFGRKHTYTIFYVIQRFDPSSTWNPQSTM